VGCESARRSPSVVRHITAINTKAGREPGFRIDGCKWAEGYTLESIARALGGFATLLVMLGNPRGDCSFQRRASMLPLQFGKGRLAQMRHEGLLSFSHPIVTRT